MVEVLIESKKFKEGDPVKVVMAHTMFEGEVTCLDESTNTLHITRGWFNLNADNVRAYHVIEVDL